jgi:kynurenine formamidase
MRMSNQPAAGLAPLLNLLTGYDVVDLTVTLSENLPAAWPTHIPFQRKVFNWYADRRNQIPPLYSSRGPYHTAWLVLDEHCGTHIDAPAHFIPPPDSGLPHASEQGRLTLDKLSLTSMMGPAAVIDVTELNDSTGSGVSPEITPELILDWERANGELMPGEIVLFRSDWDLRYLPVPEGDDYAFNSFVMKEGSGWPTPGIPALELLLDRKIQTVGVDGVSVGSAHDGAPPHQFGLGRGMHYLELLANLKALPPRGAFFIFLPIKIKGGSAGPGRAIALVPKSR